MLDWLIALLIVILLLIKILDYLDLLDLVAAALNLLAAAVMLAVQLAARLIQGVARLAASAAAQLSLSLFARFRGESCSRKIEADGADFIDGARIGAAQVARDIERGILGGAIDDVKAQQLLLGLGKRAVDHQSCAGAAQGARLLGRSEPRRRAEPALLGQAVVDAVQIIHQRRILLR
jgi:hypothetical protein